jgi:hypothetical protein
MFQQNHTRCNIQEERRHSVVKLECIYQTYDKTSVLVQILLSHTSHRSVQLSTAKVIRVEKDYVVDGKISLTCNLASALME